MGSGSLPKKLLVLVVAVAVFFGVRALTGALLTGDPGEDQDEQELVTFEGAGFQIDLPGRPEESMTRSSTPAGNVEARMYTVKNGDAAISAGVATLPAESAADLDGAARGVAYGVGGELTDVDAVEFDGYPGRDLRVTARHEDGQHLTMFSRVLLVDRQLLQVIQVVQAEDLAEPPESYARILESLRIG